MSYLWTFIWTFLLIHMATYVVSSMNGAEYEFMTATILAVITTAALFVIGTIIPKPHTEQH
ncbi:YjzD family protein [Jeotgalibacillus proteolyticus]|uniref:YjzD family protein n=1 Tax=Jeotgalibacillus proteolyticus TaxID=2082395 RepID=UPI003CEAA367